MDTLLKALLSLCERAGRIARIIRQEETLFKLSVEEKIGEAKNERFTVDYKTLADALIQETIKHFIGIQFPEMNGHIYGEESNQFTSSLGRSITIAIGETAAETVGTLEETLAGHKEIALLLAETIHDSTIEVNLTSDAVMQLKEMEFDQSKFSIWIDPLDGTNEYVKGETGCHDNGMCSHGLQCVTVLVGVFDRTTGEPVVGVVNQPFYTCNEVGVWTGRSIWGVIQGDKRIYDVPSPVGNRTSVSNVCLISSSENRELVQLIESNGQWNTRAVSGCGYKLLCVIDGLADAFVLSRDSSYQWDTCGPQAVLMALGGNILSFRAVADNGASLLTTNGSSGGRLSYTAPSGKCNNSEGIIAYSSSVMFHSLCAVLCGNN